MKSHPDVWKDNLIEQVRTVQKLLHDYYFNKEDSVGNELIGRLEQLKLSFAKGREPGEIRELYERIKLFRSHTDHLPYFNGMMKAGEAIGDIVKFEGDSAPGLDEIFNRHQSDETLENLAIELCTLIERFLIESDEHLSAKFSRELKAILERLNSRSTISLLELKAWADLATGTLLTVVETQTGVPGLKTAYDAAKIAIKVKKNLMDAYVEARAEMLANYAIEAKERALVLADSVESENDILREMPEIPETLLLESSESDFN